MLPSESQGGLRLAILVEAHEAIENELADFENYV
jgi:hypothetical protein